MTKEELAEFVKAIELKPDHKYLIFVSIESGLKRGDLEFLADSMDKRVVFCLTRYRPKDIIMPIGIQDEK